MDPDDLTGCWVVEVGVRQEWPFLGLGGADGRERRLYLDSTWDLDGQTHEATEVSAWLGLADGLSSVVITRATVAQDGALVVTAESHVLTVSGEAASYTGGEPWWLGPVQDPAAPEGFEPPAPG